MDRHAQGILFVAISAVAYSSAGFFTRLIPLDPWTILYWRGVSAGLFILVVIVVQERGNTMKAIRAIGWPGVIAALCSTFATFLFINALRRTSVADVVIIFAAAPFMTAGLGWLWFRMRESWATLMASFVALLGIIVMMGGAAHDGRLFGDLLACGMALCMSVMMLIVRRHRDTPMVPAACLSAFLCPLLVWPVAAPLQVGGMDALWLLLFGTMQFGLGLVFLTLGGRLISATEAALINTLETPLAVVWVWVAFSEIPTMASAVGGAIVMLAVAGHIWRSSQTRLAYAD